MNYHQAIEYLYQLSRLGWKLGLEKIRSLLHESGNPQERFRTIHVGGTNGKGSTSAMLESILRTAGYKTGLYTSPHLCYIGERIKCDGKNISQEELAYYTERLQPAIKRYKCTFFEAMTAIAFLYFADQKVEIAVIEVGLGGRLDATNAINPLISIITSIDLDHTKQLGNNRKSIAFEKAGIIKSGSICLTNSRHRSVKSVFEQICQERGVEHIPIDEILKINGVQLGENLTRLNLTINGSVYSQLRLSLIGDHQIQNATLAIAAAQILNSRFLPIKTEDIYQGLLNVRWPGRLQTLSVNPKVVIDVGHNPHSISCLKKSIQTIFNYRRLITIFGVCKDKNYTAMIKKLAPISKLFIAVRATTDRALSPTTIASIARESDRDVRKFKTITDGLVFALNDAHPGDLILGTGSHYAVGEIISYFNGEPSENFLSN